MGLLEALQQRIHGGRDWPPPSVSDHWLRIGRYRDRYEADPAALLQQSGREDPEDAFTPVPLAREMVRLSAALLFSEEPRIEHEGFADALEAIKDANGLNARLHAAAERVAIEGRRAIRIILDEEVSPEPILAFCDEDQVLWDVRHGDFVVGGAVVMERGVRSVGGRTVYRLIEEHTKGLVTRALYKGTATKLGQPIALDSYDAEQNAPEFFGLEEEYETGLDVPTLVRWDNVPGGHSDIAGIEPLLERIDEAESVFAVKGRRSMPITYAHRSLADERGNVAATGVILTGGNDNDAGIFGDGPNGLPIETVQPDLQSQATVEWISHLRETALMMAGYSLASWGLDRGGSADSGKALKLRQARTLLTKAGKDRMAKEAIVNALAIALAWREGASEVAPYRPVVTLGDGLPEDRLEDAQEIQTLDAAEAISTEQKVRRLNPDWDDETVAAEVEAIGNGNAAPDPVGDVLRGIASPSV
ncbi:MAG: hypothetical protein CYG60_15585 [Actinobacteria bacterium]|nr:MAG: hypothetical protein CYG60_15585 [Actinomycetota bacterium]